MPRSVEVSRTVQYWQLVDAATQQPVADVNWQDILKKAHGQQITHQCLSKEISGTVHALPILPEWNDYLPPTIQSASDYSDGNIYGLVASTDKDHVPNQRNTQDGSQKPVSVDAKHVPTDNLFVWFLPFGNVMGIMMESVSATRARAVAMWLTRLMRDQRTLPQQNFSWDAVAVIDTTRRAALQKANRMKSVFVAGTVSASSGNAFSKVFVGPSFQGNYDLEIKVKPRKDGNNAAYERDTEELMSWFDSEFGSLVGTSVNPQGPVPLSNARVTLGRDRGDDIPAGEVDLLHQRLTRKRSVRMNPGPAQAFVASSAITEIVHAYTYDFNDLQRLC